MSIKNHGVLLGRRKKDYGIVGGVGVASPIPYKVNNPTGDWIPYLPTEEKQYGANDDRSNCVTHSAQNAIKMLLNEQITNKKILIEDIEWLNQNGYIDKFGKVQFSVRFNSITNGTIPDKGNYLYVVGDDLRKIGLIPESILPDDNDISSAEYYDKNLITQKMLNLGYEFLKRFKINYVFVRTTIENLKKQLKQSPLQAVINQGTHAVAEIRRISDVYTIFDSYPPFQSERKDRPWYSLKYVLTNLTKKHMKTIGDKSNMKDVYVLGENGEINLIYNLQTRDGLHNIGIINKDLEPYWEDISKYTRGNDLIMINHE